MTPNTAHHILSALGVIGATPGIAILGRALPWPTRWLARKPLGCHACLGGHAAWMAMLARSEWYGWHEAVLVYFAATALGAWMASQVIPPPVFDFGDLDA